MDTHDRVSQLKSKHRFVLPGDSLATIEEFEPSNGAVISGDNVVSSVVGVVAPDLTNRVMIVKPSKKGIAKLPETGDYIIGKVQSAASSLAQVSIDAINDVPSSKDLSGMLSMREERHRRSAPPIRAGDIVRAKIISTINSIYHLSLDDPNCGVLYTVCSFCGGRVIALGRGGIKCTECGATDDRLLSEDFVEYSRGRR